MLNETWNWAIASEPEQVHALLTSCDAYQASRTGTPVPSRNPGRTLELVNAGSIRVLRIGTRIAGSFTLSWTHTQPDIDIWYPAAPRPAYLSRLCVDPELIGTGQLIGAQCVRKALQVAAQGGASDLRAEANPDLTDTFTMLTSMGFQQHGEIQADGLRRWAHLQKELPGRAKTVSADSALAPRP